MENLFKKALISITAISVLTITGCSNSSAADASKENNVPVEEVQKEPLDLKGLWIEEDINSESYMAAEIRDDKIGVFFILEGDDEPWTYWVGTYNAPKTSDDKYSWESTNTYAGNGMLASTAETKDFKYESGRLSYEVTINGETKTFSLIKGEWDTSNIAENAFGSVKTSQADLKSLEIADSGWFIKNEKWLYYYVDLYNPSKDVAVEYPSFRVTARDGNNILLDSTDMVLKIIYPQQHFIYGSQAFSVDEMPASVEFEPLDFEEYNLKSSSVLGEYIPLEVVNTAIRAEKLVGEVHNPTNNDYDMAIVIAIARNSAGDLLDVESTFINDIKAGDTVAFSMRHDNLDETVEIKYYAYEW